MARVARGIVALVLICRAPSLARADAAAPALGEAVAQARELAFDWGALWPFSWPNFFGGNAATPGEPSTSASAPGALQPNASEPSTIASKLQGTLPPLTFADVGGLESAKDELREVVAIFQDAEFYAALGARTPKGIMLDGPPGTGKTLLARALAGEIEANFISVDPRFFVQRWIGESEAAIGELFKLAREFAPTVIFIDEIDSMGSKRHESRQAADTVRASILDTLLTQLDGFSPTERIVVVAATNRYDELDPALVRSGRFDRRIKLTLPQEADRLRILQVHLQKRPVTADVDLDVLVGSTAGMSGADLANVCNEAATLAARGRCVAIDQPHFIEAIARVRFGVQMHATPVEAEFLRRSAIHEAGHSMLFVLRPTVVRLTETTLRPRVQGTGGVTLTAPRNESGTDMSLQQGKNLLAAMMGGRAAEFVIYGEANSGASSDLEKATRLAFSMVTELGISVDAAPVHYAALRALRGGVWSPTSGDLVDAAVQALLHEAYDSAVNVLTERKAALERVATALVAEKTLYAAQVMAILEDE